MEESSSDSAPPSPLKREETGLAVREMLKESYREFTGHALPDYMTNEQAKVELNKFIFQWDDVDDDEEEGEDGEKSPAHNMSLSTILVASKFARKLGKQTKARRARMPRNEEWDPDALELLKASYREITGSARPSSMTPTQAYRTLQAALRSDVMMSFDPLLDAVPEDNFSVDAEAKKLEGKEKEWVQRADGLGGHAVLNDPDADRALATDAAARKASATKAEVETARAGLDWRDGVLPALTAVCIALGEPLAASVSPEDAYAHATGLAVAQEGIDYSLGGEKESLTDVRKRMEAQAAAPSRIVPRGKGEKDDASFEKRLEVVSELKNATLVVPQLPGGKETNLQYSMRLDAQRKSAAPVLPIGEHEEMSGDAERPADYEKRLLAAEATGSRVVLGRPPCALLPKGRHEGAKEFAARLAAAAQCSVLVFPQGEAEGADDAAARYAAQAKAPAQLLWPYDPGLEDHADFRARLAAASEPAPVPKMLGIVEALKAGGRRLSGIGSTKDLSHLAGAEGSVSTSGKSPGSTPGKAGRRRSSFELIGKGWAGLRGKRLSQIVVAAQKGEEKGLEAAAAGGMTFRPSEATHAAYNGTAKVHDGWMVKRPEKFGKAQRRWFVLHEDGRMHYFEDSSCATQKGVATILGVTAGDVQLVKSTLSAAKDNDYTFRIRTRARTWAVNPGTDAAFKAWRKNLLAVAAKNVASGGM